jgi:heme exporter protein A
MSISDISLEGTTVVYGALRALARVSLSVSAGDVVGVMGPNGAGKSTILGLLSLLQRPTRGKVLFNGDPAGENIAQLRGHIGYLSHEPLVYPALTGTENLLFFARLFGVEDAAVRVHDLEIELGLTGFTARPTRLLSRGQLQRIALARSLIAKPDLLLLDEPAAGLDRAAVDRIDKVIGELKARNGLAIIVTHEPEVAARIANRAVIVSRGRIAADVEAPDSSAGWTELYSSTIKGSGA